MINTRLLPVWPDSRPWSQSQLSDKSDKTNYHWLHHLGLWLHIRSIWCSFSSFWRCPFYFLAILYLDYNYFGNKVLKELFLLDEGPVQKVSASNGCGWWITRALHSQYRDQPILFRAQIWSTVAVPGLLSIIVTTATLKQTMARPLFSPVSPPDIPLVTPWSRHRPAPAPAAAY